MHATVGCVCVSLCDVSLSLSVTCVSSVSLCDMREREGDCPRGATATSVQLTWVHAYDRRQHMLFLCTCIRDLCVFVCLFVSVCDVSDRDTYRKNLCVSVCLFGPFCDMSLFFVWLSVKCFQLYTLHVYTRIYTLLIMRCPISRSKLLLPPPPRRWECKARCHSSSSVAFVGFAVNVRRSRPRHGNVEWWGWVEKRSSDQRLRARTGFRFRSTSSS